MNIDLPISGMFEIQLSIFRMTEPENFCLFGCDTEILENPSELHAEQNKSNVLLQFPLSSKRNKQNKVDFKNKKENWPPLSF